MKLSTSVDVTKEPFHLNHEKSSRKPNWEIYHAHSCMEFLYVYEGVGRVEVNKRWYTIEPGSLLIFQPFQLHRIQIQGPFVRSILMFDPYRLDTALRAFSGIRTWFNTLWKQALANHVITQQQHLAKMYEHLHGKLSRVTTHKQQEEFVLCLLSMLQQLEPYESEICEAQRDKQKLSSNHTTGQITEWIEKHYKDKFDLQRMSEDLHLSTFYLSHIFRQSTGRTITEFIISRRLKEACLLLETTSKSASFIAQEVGFRNGSYFSRVFKSVLGTTPKSYRKQV
ncbi:helix-turn-helix domain-containing protein [Paenibacillus qinlingensis]|uniref:helix-turn-helix domain-containing protein n=1 Tax=Paenibacillus qinlingensis TaxID=1837343 RepID=UPI001565C194|nr:AraC family transcriptional regulator [Paenibacillus qinlingensis]NQX57820.1 helix-turn-helix transcriptional regulator [Paenibacillus qinlingensis]